MLWLLDQQLAADIRERQKRGDFPDAAQVAEFEAILQRDDDEDEKKNSALRISGNTAFISVTGVLTDRPSFFARYYGGGNTTYSDIVAGIATAEANTNVERIQLNVDSGGGSATAGWQEAMRAVANAEKPVDANVGNLAASAAYGIASQASTINVANELSAVGSIGVATRMFKFSDEREITSTNAPNKRPDPDTDAGMKAIQAELDQIESVFIQQVATGRGVSEATVKSDFGQGGILYANQAEKAGMIDSIGNTSTESPTSTNTAATAGGDEPTGVQTMDLATLKAEHPATYAAAIAEGQEQGQANEQARVNAHLKLAEASGAMDVATKAIADGTPAGDGLVMAEHQAAMLGKLGATQQAADEETVAEAADNVDTSNGEAADPFKDAMAYMQGDLANEVVA